MVHQFSAPQGVLIPPKTLTSEGWCFSHQRGEAAELVGAQAPRALGSLISSHTRGVHPAQDPAPGMQHQSAQQHLDCPARWVQQSHQRFLLLPDLPGSSSKARAARAAESPPRQAWSSISVATHSPFSARPLDTGTLQRRVVSRGHGRRASGIPIPWQVSQECKALGNRSPAGL